MLLQHLTLLYKRKPQSAQHSVFLLQVVSWPLCVSWDTPENMLPACQLLTVQQASQRTNKKETVPDTRAVSQTLKLPHPQEKKKYLPSSSSGTASHWIRAKSRRITRQAMPIPRKVAAAPWKKAEQARWSFLETKQPSP